MKKLWLSTHTSQLIGYKILIIYVEPVEHLGLDGSLS